MVYDLIAIDSGIGQFTSNRDALDQPSYHREKRRGNSDGEYHLPHSHRRRILPQLRS